MRWTEWQVQQYWQYFHCQVIGLQVFNLGLCFPAYTCTSICMKLLHTKNILCTFLSDHLRFEET